MASGASGVVIEEDARAWVMAHWGEIATEKLDRLAAMVVEENQQQNLIGAASVPNLWVRHIVDSAQLVVLASERQGLWMDVGSGGGFPGIVIAILRPQPTLLVEPRRRRAEFLIQTLAALEVDRAEVVCGRVEAISTPASIISARAVAAPAKLFDLTRAVTMPDTLFLLPSGRDAEHTLAETQRHWRGVFHVKQSITDATSKIIVATSVSRK